MNIYIYYSLISGIIDGESEYNLENVKFSNIKSSSKTILNFEYNNIKINNIEVENISCTGDNGDSSFILFNSDDNNNTFSISNSIIKNSISNGPFIKITGNANSFKLENTTIYNITSYGPIIDDNSKKVIACLNF